MRRTAVSQARGVFYESRNRCARSFLALVGVDLGEDHLAERMCNVSTGLPSNFRQLVAQPRRRIPPARADFHTREEEQTGREAWAEPRPRLRDQFLPDLAG